MAVSPSEIKNFVRIVFLCIAWYIVSSSNGVIGKWILTDFPHPMTLTMVQLLSITVYSAPMLRILGVRKIHDLGWNYYAKAILPLAFAKFLSSVLAHVSIWKVPVSYAHTVKASMPLFTVILSRVLLGERHTYKIYLSLVPIIFGVAVATVTEISFDIIGLGSALLATAGFSVMNIFSKKVMKDTGVHHLRLLHVLGQLALIMFLPFWAIMDFRQVIQHPLLTAENASFSIVFLLAIDGALHWMQNILAFTILKLVAPLTYAVANVTKRIAVITASLMLLQNPITWSNLGGMLMAISGVFLYNKVKYDENKARTSLPATTRDVKKFQSSLWSGNYDAAKVKLAMPTDYLSNDLYRTQ